jgi:hypothetical protein
MIPVGQGCSASHNMFLPEISMIHKYSYTDKWLLDSELGES